MIRPIRLLASFATVGGWTLASRVLGFVRDILIAATLGSGPAAQAFLVAFSLPNLFRRFFAEGAFNTAFVPMFSKKAERGDDPEGFANEAFSVLATILIVFTVLAMLSMPWLVLGLASGFAGDDRFDLAVSLGRWAGILRGRSHGPCRLQVWRNSSFCGGALNVQASKSAPVCRASAPICARSPLSRFPQPWRAGSCKSTPSSVGRSRAFLMALWLG